MSLENIAGILLPLTNLDYSRTEVAVAARKWLMKL